MFRKNKNNKEHDTRNSPAVSNSRSTYSYHSSRSMREGSNARYTRAEQEVMSVEKRTKYIRHIPAYIAVIVIIASLIYAITLSQNAKVEVVGNSSNTFLQSPKVYQQAVDKILKSSYLNKSKLTIDTDTISSQIDAEFPELNGVTLVVPLSGHQPILEIRPAKSVVVLSNSQGKFMINQNGAAMVKLDTPNKLQQFNLPVVTDDSGLNVKLGSQVLPVASMAFINTVITQFAAKNIPIQSMTLVAVPYELDVQVRGVPYVVKFNLMSDANYAVGTYFSTVQELATLKQTPAQYIDIRIPGRAYYK